MNNMNIKKQDFNGSEMAMLYLAFTKNLFTKPNIGDIWFIGHKQDSGSTFYFKLEYYDQLKSEMQFANSQDEFAQSNANNDWMNLMNRLINSVTETSELENNLDYNRIAATEVEHIQVLQKFRSTQKSTEKKLDLAKQIIVKVKDEQNRRLEESEYNNKGELSKIVFYKYLDGENILEKRTVELTGTLGYSFIHRY